MRRQPADTGTLKVWKINNSHKIAFSKTTVLHRLWDAVGGFLFLFAHMQEKLSKNSTQVDLLQELLNLQKDLIVMMLSMLEGKRTLKNG